ncbi:MAG TPA: DnaJ domain-containing protein [Gemmatimonadales bacterium]|nr:DnaJ domain-containing protein [Gemmatimonadales bacterium]
MPNPHAESFYERLDLATSASADEVRRAYRSMLRKYPPERHPEEFKRIREAYETLSNSESRHAYDTRPDPAVAGPLQRGMQALTTDDHATAERCFKQVLLIDPSMAYVRNLLGLAIAYQERFEQALEQFKQILTLPQAAAAWFGNAGHTYLKLERFEEARVAFETAAARAQDNPVSYYIGLADALCGLKRYREASHVLEKGILADGTVDFEDLDYFVKLLHVHIRSRRAEDVRHTLLRMQEIAADDEQRRLLAYKVGSLSRQLLHAELYDYAYATSVLARDLEPTDGDYDALSRLASLLHHKKSAEAEQLVAHHPSFGVGGWLQPTGFWLSGHLRDSQMYGGITPIKAAPGLATINGVGTRLYGRRDPDPENNSHTATLFFTVLFVPVFPIACYRVIETGSGQWRFLGKMPWSKFEKWYASVVTLGVISLVMMGSTGSSGSFASSGRRLVETPAPAYAPQTASADDYFQPGNQRAVTSFEPSSFEREALTRRRNEIERRYDELAALEEQLNEIDRKTDAIEAGASYISIEDPEYGRLIREYNRIVEDYNLQRGLLTTDAEALQRDIDAFNARLP